MSSTEITTQAEITASIARSLLEEDYERARELDGKSLATNTIAAYDSAWRAFATWCEQRQVSAVPVKSEDLRAYLAFLAYNKEKKVKFSTIQVAYSAICYVQRRKGDWGRDGKASYEVRDALKAIKNDLNTRPKGKKPLFDREIKEIAEYLYNDDIENIRNLAIILIGFLGGLRRSEITSIRFEEIEFHNEGIIIHWDKTKTGMQDKEIFAIKENKRICPVHNLQRWINVANIKEGYVFRPFTRGMKIINKQMYNGTIAKIVKDAVEILGKSIEEFAGHSLRSGLITSVSKSGKQDSEIMNFTGHKSHSSFQRYVKEANKFENNVAENLFGRKK